MRREELWTCEACGEARPDSVMEVASETVYAHGAVWTRNVNHCSDREGCRRAAEAICAGWLADFGETFTKRQNVGPSAFTVGRFGGIYSITSGKPPWWRPWARAWYWMRGHDVMKGSRAPDVPIGRALHDAAAGETVEVELSGER